jgi:hypothetical protein
MSSSKGSATANPPRAGGSRRREILAPFVVREEPEHSYVRIEFGDGADIYLDGDDMMANHISAFSLGISSWQEHSPLTG